VIAEQVNLTGYYFIFVIAEQVNLTGYYFIFVITEQVNLTVYYFIFVITEQVNLTVYYFISKLDWQNQQQRRGGTPGHQQTDRSPGRGMSRQDSRDDTNDKEEYSTRYYQVLVFG
jgi:hypothetical protein